jgi:hypothetical protein
MPMWAMALGQAAPAATGIPTFDCYNCGFQGYRWMTPGIASQVPGGCPKVDDSLCPQPKPGAAPAPAAAAVQPLPAAGPAPQPAPPAPSAAPAPAPAPPPPAAGPAPEPTQPPVPHPAPPPVGPPPPGPPTVVVFPGMGPAGCLRLGPTDLLTVERARELGRRGFALWEVPVRLTPRGLVVLEAWACTPRTVPREGSPLKRPLRTRGPLTGPLEPVPADQAGRLLDLALRARRTLDDAVLGASGPGATDEDRAAAAAVAACLDELVKAAGPLDDMVAALEAAVLARSPAAIAVEQAAALGTFVDCARGAEAARAKASSGGGVIEAIVGIGLPAAAAVAVAL